MNAFLHFVDDLWHASSPATRCPHQTHDGVGCVACEDSVMIARSPSLRIITVFCGGLAILLLPSCTRPVPVAGGGGAAPAPAAPAVAVDAPKGKDIADPVLRESREQADAILDGLLAGKFDQDSNLSPVARKLKGYQSWSVTSQKMTRPDAAEFGGTLAGPAGQAAFDMLLVKQQSGKWAVATFSGPNSK